MDIALNGSVRKNKQSKDTQKENEEKSDDKSEKSVSAEASATGKGTVYEDASGNKYEKIDGTPAWRNNNPGNIRDGEFAKNHGAIGEANGFAVFPDERTGMGAVRSLLQTNTYQNLNLGDAISRYAPSSENNTAAYQNFVQRGTGISLDTSMRGLNNSQIQAIADVIRQYEGWREGRIIRY